MPLTQEFHPTETIVLVGMMGAGKTAIGRRIAKQLNLAFIDADDEIETAAGCAIEDIFKKHGETEFRDGERRVIKRLLQQPVHVLATGGGAFMDSETRAEILKNSVSVWLRADFDVLWRRVSRRSHRPMLKTADPRATLAELIEKRYPTYKSADITVESRDAPPGETVDRVIEALRNYYSSRKGTDERS
ncbi:MAG: shikimate kinase [Alphaproteobacteria bacterium]|nr:shikimate kinase [Alphaproteobacteria bacterium]